MTLLRPARSAGGRNQAGSHRCPAMHCKIFVPMHRLACSTHWYQLPEQLRDEINRTFRRDRRRHLQLYVEAVRLLTNPALIDERTRL